MPCNCQQFQYVFVPSPERAFPIQGQSPLPLSGQPGPGGLIPFLPGGGGIPGGGLPGGGGFLPGQPGGVPPQLAPANLPGILGQFQRPFGQPPQQMIFLFNMLQNNPGLLQSFIQQRPQSLQQAVQFAQFGPGFVQREPEERILPGFCYNRWSLVFTFSNVFVMFPVTNLFGFVIGYCYPFLNPCIVPDFQIVFALC
ncbi:hypothetical protein [Paenibacillus humicola]|uniref:hypothetical protein n=1 Tax=Paenibacillus humicola TaxID=3110540 RepID=UPI00237ACF3F|nr:hypothetical protein [Paenibacillus humicola]